MKLSNDLMLPQLREALEKIKSQNADTFYAWKITVQHYRSLQTLMIGSPGKNFENYQNREVLDHSYQIEIYTRHSNPMLMGSSSFSIDPLDNLENQVIKTFNNSLLVGNKPWDLPTKLNAPYEKVLTVDLVIAESLVAAHNKIQDEINNKVKMLTKVNVNSGELFTNLKTIYFETSLGLSGQKENSDIYFEMAIEKLPTPNTQEVLKYKKAMSIEDANLSKFIDDSVEETLSISVPQVPKTSENCTILVNEEVICNLLANIVLQLSANREYDKSPFHSRGDSLLKGEKVQGSDRISITLDPSTPVMALTTPFTNEGMKPVRAEIVKDDTVIVQLVNNQIGQYLEKEPNYIEGNMLVKSGTLTKEELLNSANECIEIIAFSSLLISSNTLTWSSEIKLGKLFKNGKFHSMIKGGVVSGNIKENLTNFKFSKDEIKFNDIGGWGLTKGYVGPSYMLIKSGVKVVGE